MIALVAWAPDADRFLDGVQMGVYVGLLALAALLVIATVRRLLSV